MCCQDDDEESIFDVVDAEKLIEKHQANRKRLEYHMVNEMLGILRHRNHWLLEYQHDGEQIAKLTRFIEKQKEQESEKEKAQG